LHANRRTRHGDADEARSFITTSRRRLAGSSRTRTHPASRARAVAEASFALPLIDLAAARGFDAKVAIMDKGYDQGPIHDGCMDRGIAPVTALIQTSRVKRGDHKPPTCEHGTWTFRRSRLQAQGDQVALPDRRVRSRFPVDQG
jgi:hypothetical protein